MSGVMKLSEELARAVEIARELERRKQRNQLANYIPYEYQEKFHNTDEPQRLLMAGNRVGKSMCGAMEMAYHLTGKYPKWWKGRKFVKPIRAWVGGVSNETTRDVCQKELLGQPDDPAARGTGSIPAELIGETVRKPGVPNAVNSLVVKHVTGGNSRLKHMKWEKKSGWEKL